MSSPSDLDRSYNSSVRVTSAWLNAINSRLLNGDGSDWRRWTDADLDVSPGSLSDRVAKISDQLRVQAGIGLSVSVFPGRVGLSDGTTLEVGNIVASVPASLTLADDSNLFVYVSANGLGFGETLPSGALLLAAAQTAGGILVSLEDRRSLFSVFGDSEGMIGDRLDSLEAVSDTLDGAITTINQSIDTIDSAITNIQSTFNFSDASGGDFVRIGVAGELVADSLIGGQIASISDAIDTLASGLAGVEETLDFAGATAGDFIRIDSFGNLAAQTTNLGVMSVGLTAPEVFTVSSSPVTGSGSLAISFAGGQSPNQFLASPPGVAGAVGLRSIVADDIPSLGASKITTGILDPARIPDLDASKITTGILDPARIPDLDASKITTGILDPARIPDLEMAVAVQANPPTSTTNATLGAQIYATSNDRKYLCIDATTNANAWAYWNRDGVASGGIYTYPGGTLTNVVGADTAPNKAIADTDIGWAIGTNFGTTGFSNPFTSGKITATTSGLYDGTTTPVWLFDRAQDASTGVTGSFLTDLSANGFFTLRFTGYKIQPTYVAMQHSNSTAEMFRNITISGSQNGVTFTSLITVTNTSGDRAWVASSVPGSTLWTFLRFQQTSVNSSGNNRFEMGDLLIWGTLSNE
jgi:hypothetical protein